MPGTIASMRAMLSDGKPRRGRPRSADQDAIPRVILQAALMLFKKQGLDATSIEQIAAAASASKSTIYRHFGTKEALAEAAIALDGRHVLETIGQFECTDPDPLVRLRELSFAIADFTALPSSANLYRLSLSAVPRIPAIGLAFAETGTALQALMLPDIKAAQGTGQMAEGEPEQLARQLYAAVIMPIWSDALLMMDYVVDDVRRRGVVAENWRLFLAGAGV